MIDSCGWIRIRCNQLMLLPSLFVFTIVTYFGIHHYVYIPSPHLLGEYSALGGEECKGSWTLHALSVVLRQF
jgi:hypothetical protein